MSASTTMLGWGLLRFKDAYDHAGQLEYMYDCIRWPLEWMIKAHTAPEELYVQVSDRLRMLLYYIWYIRTMN